MADRAIESSSYDRWHELLTTRFVCENCLTRFFVPYHHCPACHQFGRIQPLVTMLQKIARNDADLRAMISEGQRVTHAAGSP